MYREKFLPKFLMVSISIILLLAAGAILTLLLTGRLAVAWKQPSQQAIVVGKTVCGDTIVATYNAVSLYEPRGNSTEYTVDEPGLKKLVSEIKGSSGYQDDPTCQTILLLAAVQDKDYAAAKKAYSAVKALHSKHMYADSNLATAGSLSSYEKFIEELAPARKGGDTQSVHGGA